MCGRYVLISSSELVAALFGLAELPRIIPRYNIAPTQLAPVVREQPGGRRRMDALRWGLIPSWAKDPAIGSKMINARSETVDEKPAFHTAFERQRCLVPADGFYEWKPVGPRRKQPYFIRRADRQPFAFAGLWERWRMEGHDAVDSFTILTTEPNEMVRPLHDRMPVIVRPEDFETWLDPDLTTTRPLKPLLRPIASSVLTADPVSRAVNRVDHDEPDCITPVAPEREDAGDEGSQRLLFE